MQKWFLGFAVSIFFPMLVSAQNFGIPASAVTDFSVVNVSQENSDAQKVGARAGDVLRYELKIQSGVEDVNNFVATVDLVQLLDGFEMVDAGLGKIDGNTLTFPPFSHLAPCEQIFTFFARAKENCGQLQSVVVSSTGKTITVPVNCKLAKVGPSADMLIFGGFLIALFIAHLMIRRMKTV